MIVSVQTCIASIISFLGSFLSVSFGEGITLASLLIAFFVVSIVINITLRMR